MPKTIVGPRGKSITFDEESHKYTTKSGTQYHSVTTLIHSLFPEFEAEKVAYFCARKNLFKEGDYDSVKDVPKPLIMEARNKLLEQWEDKRDKASILGDTVHRYAECKLKDIPFDMQATTKRQKTLIKSLDNFLPMLLEEYEFVDAEKVVFSSKYLVAGTIDLLMRSKSTGKICIFDWKTNEEIKTNNVYDQYGNLFLSHVPHINYYHYALQLNVYYQILSEEGYYKDLDKFFTIWHVQSKDVVGHVLPWMPNEAKQILDFSKRMSVKEINI